MSKSTTPLERVARKPAKRTRRSVIRWTKRVVLALGALGIIGVIVKAMLPDRVPVDVATVSRGPLDVEIREDGQTRVRDRFVISSPITGELERITLQPGATVDAGAIVARIQPPSPGLLDDRTRGEAVARLAAARAHERQAQRAIARAKLARDQAGRDAKRTRTLAARGVSTGAERERADLAEQLAAEDLAATELQHRAAVAEIGALRATLEPRSGPRVPVPVHAPAAGRVLRVVRESGGPIAAGAPLVEIGNPSELEVVIDVLSRDAERIRPGMLVELTTSAAKPRRGTVRLIEPSAFTRVSALGVEEQRVNVIADLDGPATELGDGYRVDARIVTWRGANVLQVPSSALFRIGASWATYVVAGDHARAQPVTIGHRGRTHVEVTSGLAAGDRVIVHPSDRVRDGGQIVIR